MTTNHPGRHLLGGTLRSLAAESLFPLTALITGAFLTRHLGPEGYGILVLAATWVGWVEWSMNAYFARPAIKLVSEAGDWKIVADALVHQQLRAGVAVMLLLWALAAPVSALLHEPRLAWYVALFALDVPLFNLVHAHRNVLIGKGDFAHSANLSAVRWLCRLALILALVGGGLSVAGAILGTVGASLAELIVARRYVRPSLFGASQPVPLWSLGAPLLFSALCLGLYTRLDVFALKTLRVATHQIGIYGAAQSLSLLPGLFSLAFMPLLLSTLSRLLARGEEDAAKEIATNALRAVIGLMPLAAIVAASAPDIVAAFFGPDFVSGGTVLAVLIVGSFSLMTIPIASAVFVATGTPRRIPWLTVPLVPLALAGHLLVIPSFGGPGAAAVTTGVAAIGASAALWWINRVWQIKVPRTTVARSLVVSAVGYFAAAVWPMPGLLVLVKLPVLAICCGALFLALGEFTLDEFGMSHPLLIRERR